jgi:hypothetical protein
VAARLTYVETLHPFLTEFVCSGGVGVSPIIGHAHAARVSALMMTPIYLSYEKLRSYPGIHQH